MTPQEETCVFRFTEGFIALTGGGEPLFSKKKLLIAGSFLPSDCLFRRQLFHPSCHLHELVDDVGDCSQLHLFSKRAAPFRTLFP